MKNIKEKDNIFYKVREFGNLANGDIFRQVLSNDIIWIKNGKENGVALDDGLLGMFDSDEKVILVTSIVYELEKN